MSLRGWLRKKENQERVKRFLKKTGATTIKVTKAGARASYKGYQGTKTLAIKSRSTFHKAKKEYKDWERILSPPKRRRKRMGRKSRRGRKKKRR